MQNKGQPTKAERKLAEEKARLTRALTEDAKLRLLSARFVPHSVLVALWKDKSARVRLWVARNPGLQVGFLQLLVDDADLAVRTEAARVLAGRPPDEFLKPFKRLWQPRTAPPCVRKGVKAGRKAPGSGSAGLD